MEVLDYYTLLGLKREYSAVKLFVHFLSRARRALNQKDIDVFLKLRMGYEVLRDEDSAKAYHLIYRKYVLNIRLNYPKVKEEQLFRTFRAKEEKAQNYVESLGGKMPSFLAYFVLFIGKFLAFDILSVVRHGRSGLFFLVGGLYTILVFETVVNIGGGIFLVLVSILLFRWNLIRYVRNYF